MIIIRMLAAYAIAALAVSAIPAGLATYIVVRGWRQERREGR